MSAKPGTRTGFLLSWAFTMIMAGALLVGALVAYGIISSGYEEQLERRLKTYAASSAATLSPGGLSGIAATDDALAELYRKRLMALQHNSGVRRAAVLRRDGTLILDTQGHDFGSRDYGFAADANELEQCFEQGPLTTITYTDEDGGLYRNGFAPVPNEDGTPSEYAVAVELEADYADKLNAIGMTMGLTVACVFLVTLAAALLLARAWNRLQRDLSRQTRLAEQAQFSAGMAHQIKNPLAALRGYVELLARGLGDPMQKQLADKLVSEVGALDRIVRDFLQFSRGAHGSVEKLTLEAVLRPVIESARAVGGEKVSIKQQDLPGVELEIDSTAVREALSNVVVNAAEAMRDEGGELSVRAQVGGGLVILEIQDSGPGIAEEVRDKLFEPFVTGKADGTGLGLPIARRLLRDLGGDLELIRSDSSGTMFRATFQKEAD